MGGDRILPTVSCNSSSCCSADSEEESSSQIYDYAELAILNGNPSIMNFEDDDILGLSTQLMKSYSEATSRIVSNPLDKKVALKDDQKVEFDVMKGSNGPTESDTNLRKQNVDMKHCDESGAGQENLYKSMEIKSLRSTGSTTEFDVQIRDNACREVMRSYDDLLARVKSLSEARNKILSYAPGTWIENDSINYEIPTTTTLLLIGPKGSGKSNLINRISRVFEDDKFASERAQVSYNSSIKDGTGTYFLQEYMVPRNAGCFCLFDTRSLSDDFFENYEVLRRWMTKGVRHGELVTRISDNPSLRAALKSKARSGISQSSDIRKVNFVIFVVSGISVLRSMNSDCGEDRRYAQMLAESFNCPHLSFKDDKPVVVVTHGDLLSLDDRARVRVYLGEILGVSPTKQVFDISEDSEPSTNLVIVDMIRRCLEHADRNLPCKGWWYWSVLDKARGAFGWVLVFMVILLAVGIASSCSQLHYGGKGAPHHEFPKPRWKPSREWHTMRHLWLED